MRALTFAVLLFLTAACTPPPPPPTPAEQEITADSLTAHIKMLASDEFGGRAPATPGGVKATEYLAKELAALGIEPGAPDGTFFQQVPIVESVADRSFVLSVPGYPAGRSMR